MRARECLIERLDWREIFLNAHLARNICLEHALASFIKVCCWTRICNEGATLMVTQLCIPAAVGGLRLLAMPIGCPASGDDQWYAPSKC